MKALMTQLVLAGIVLAGPVSTALAGRSTTQEEPGDAWPVRLAYWDEEHNPDLKLKGKWTASIENRALTLRDANGTMVDIPCESIRSVFYDQALWKKYLETASRPAPGEVKERSAYINTQVALGAFGAVATVGGLTTGGALGAVAPALAFPPAFAIAAGGIVAVEMLKDNPRHFVHIIWEEESAFHGAALAIKGKFAHPLLSALDEATLEKSLNLPARRKTLRREIREARRHAMRLIVAKNTSFGGVILKKKPEGSYRLVLLERKDSPDELYFFYPSVRVKNLTQVTLVETVAGDRSGEPDSNIGKGIPNNWVRYASNEDDRIEEIQIRGKRVRNPVPVS